MWTLFVVNVLVGLLFSPMTSIRKLRVLGAQPHDEDRLTSLGHALQGRPFARVGVTQLESDVLRQRDVYDARLSHNLFGSAVLTLKYRRPIAELVGAPHTYLDDQGVIFGSPEPIQGLRQVALSPDYMRAGVALTLPWPSVSVAELITKLDSFDQLKNAAVHLDTTGRLLISRKDKHTVDLGGSGQLDDKLAKLRSMLEEQPQLLDRVQALSLADPMHPAFKPIRNASQ